VHTIDRCNFSSRVSCLPSRVMHEIASTSVAKSVQSNFRPRAPIVSRQTPRGNFINVRYGRPNGVRGVIERSGASYSHDFVSESGPGRGPRL